jgi:hypothetical protein
MAPPPPLPRSRWPRRIIALLIGLAILPALELMLHLTDIAPNGTPEWEIFSNINPAFVRQGPIYRTNSRHLLDQAFAVEKPANVTRIFIVGGSSAMGFPLETTASPAILLAAALDAIEPGRRHEVISAAGFASDTRAVTRIVEEIVHYRPDLIIVMTGHNEYLEQRYFTGLARLRLYRVIEELITLARNQPDRYLPHAVSSEERAFMEADFRHMLELMANICQARKVKLVLATLPANIQDFRPYGPSSVPANLQEQVDRKVSSDDENVFASALGPVATHQKEGDAWAAFIHGVWGLMNAYHHAESPEAAKDMIAPDNALLQTAVDLDPYPVRVTSSLNTIIGDVAKSHHLVLVDLDQIFASYRADLRHQDFNFFFDHCHLNFDGEKIVVTDLIVAGFKTDVIPAVNFWDREADAAYAKLAPDNQALAEAYYKTGYEAGINMDRVHRGLDFANKALELNPGHAKAKMLRDRLEPIAKQRYRLIGD